MGFFKKGEDAVSCSPMDHIDAGIDENTELDHPVVEFEVDIGPDQVGCLPRIYPRPHELHTKLHGERIGPPYAMVIDREAVAGLNPEMLDLVHTSKLPLGRSDGPLVTVMLSSIFPPEVKLLCAVGADRYVSSEGSRMDLLAAELQRLDARNVARDYIFFGRRLRLKIKAYHYAVGGYGRGGRPHSGVKLELVWIAVEL